MVGRLAMNIFIFYFIKIIAAKICLIHYYTWQKTLNIRIYIVFHKVLSQWGCFQNRE